MAPGLSLSTCSKLRVRNGVGSIIECLFKTSSTKWRRVHHRVPVQNFEYKKVPGTEFRMNQTTGDLAVANLFVYRRQ